MKVHETRSHAQSSGEEEGRIGTRKQKAESRGQEVEVPGSNKKKAKVVNNENENGNANGKSAADVAAEFEEFCKATREHLSIREMRAILEANGQDASDSDDAVVPRCQDMMFYGPMKRCTVCNGQLDCTGSNYKCRGGYNEWTTCMYSTRDSPRKEEALKVPDGIDNTMVPDWAKNQDGNPYPQRQLTPPDEPFSGMVIVLSGRLSRTHQYWKEEIEKHGGKVSNSVAGATCLVVSPAERARGGSIQIVYALERKIPVVSEAWLIDSIQKQAPQPLDAYDGLPLLFPEGREIPRDKLDPSEEALESISAELKLYGKRGVHKDSKLRDRDGYIFEKDGILFNCAFALCDQGKSLNHFCIMQLIMVPEDQLYLYYKKGRIGNDLRAEDRVEEWNNNVNDAVNEFVRLFEELTGNEFEPWEREKKFQKKYLKFYPIDMDDGIDARYGGLSLRQLGPAATHCKLEPLVTNLMKVLCYQDIYKFALMEMGLDSPDIPMGMVSSIHLKRCEEELLNFREVLRLGPRATEQVNALWLDFSNKWFTLMPSTRPLILKDYQELADNAAVALETVRDMTDASHIIGDMTGSTLDDPLFDRYRKLGCSVTPLDKRSDEYEMIVNYLETTYEPFTVSDVSYGVSVERIFAVESSACPSYNDIKKLPNKVLLWCGTKTSNLLRHLHKGFLPAICSLPVPGYMYGRAIVCSDAAADAARCGFTAVGRPEGFLVLAVASLGNKVIEISSVPKDTKSLEEKKISVKGLGKKKPEESEHFMWKHDIKVPFGRLVPSGKKDSPLEYNEYAVYDPKQVSMRYLVGVRYEEMNVEMDVAE